MKKSTLQILAFAIGLWLLSVPAHANYLRVSGVTADQAAGTVTFGLRWNNSWRTNLPPFNWDAAWVFVKFRECGVDPNTEWTHGIINLAGSTLPAALESTTRLGTPGIDADNLGVMLRRTAVGRFTDAAPNSVTLAITNMIPDGTPMDIKVFGIEMVFIPQGGFFVGDGNSNSFSVNAQFNVQYIGAASGMTITNTGTGASAVTVPATYPNGFGAFYMMKYEITHGQYAGFMNTIPASARAFRNIRTAVPAPPNNFRNVLMDNGADPEAFYATHPDRALNYLSFDDLMAYLDWAALRPFTELEYEKACRGSMPVITNEYAWGNGTIVAGNTFNVTVPAENGTELFLEPTSNCTFSNTAFTGGMGGLGPARVGIHARTDPNVATRTLSGASYYGVLDLSGNVWEYVVALSANAIAEFQGGNGDGYLTADGNHNVATWPVPAAPVVINNARGGLRGGAYNSGTVAGSDGSLTVAARRYCREGYNARVFSVGGRGAR